MITQTETYKLTQYSTAAGSGCKISSDVLAKILHGADSASPVIGANYANLLVGNDSRDDAAIMELGNGEAIISTTDFFTPIVDDAADFGSIAAANAISNVYAMGGEPIMAVAILGWPLDKLPPELAGQVLAGARETCAAAGIPLAGGHSIESPEPIFGLAVTGRTRLNRIKQNNTGTAGCCLYLTKPLGTGILNTAQQQGVLLPEQAGLAIEQMAQLNRFGIVLGKLPYVKALTDVSSFGLLGHLVGMAEASGLSAEIHFDKIPQLPGLENYLSYSTIPDCTHKNWDGYSHKVGAMTEEQRYILADPQVNGGLLIAIEPGSASEFEQVAYENNLKLTSIGQLVEKRENVIYVV